jgi:antibiotic biosynthesis monooxygenase (ABM) superfamily enzyme
MTPAEWPAGAAASAAQHAVAIVTQTRVRPECDRRFAQWQDEISAAIRKFPGFIDQEVISPKPPTQGDWVIVQRFSSTDTALAWLRSEERLNRVNEAGPMLAGNDDVHILDDGDRGVLPSPASAVISTRIKPGQEAAYRAWEHRIALAQSRAPGFQGYRFEPPKPGVQDDWLAIVRFDGEANLQAWLDSPERQRLLEESKTFTEEFHSRIARTGFDQWFRTAGVNRAAIPVWKQNMIVILMLYPVVFLFGVFVTGPLLLGRLHLPFTIALFIGNVFSVISLNFLVPWTSGRFSWWLASENSNSWWVKAGGVALIAALYMFLMLAFWTLF